MKKHIYLIGFMGTGKTSTSRHLKDLLNWPEVDVDSMIVKEQGCPIPEIFSEHGEDYFRNIESDAMERIGYMSPAIVSCGGGVVVRQKNIDVMKASGTIVLLTATPETVYDRVKCSNNRPMLKGNMNVEYIGQLMEKRRQAYEDAADIVIATDGKSPMQVAEEIIDRIRG